MQFLKKLTNTFLPKSRFGRGVSVLAGGTIVSQGIVVASSPLLTRLYLPDQFGILSIYTSILLIIGVFCCFRYQLAIPLPKEDRDATHLVILSLGGTVVVAFVTLVAVTFYRDLISHLLSAPSLKRFLWLLPISVLVLGAYQTFTFWTIREKKFVELSGAKISRSTSLVGTQLVGFPAGSVALVMSWLVGDTVASVSIGYWFVRKHASHFKAIEMRRVWELAKEHKAFPLISTWNGLCYTGSSYFPVLLIGYYLGVPAAGIYGLAYRVLSAPMSIVGRAVGDVLYSEAVGASKDRRLGFLMESVHKNLATAAAPAAAFGFVVAPYVFVVVFGQDWQLAGEVARPMIVWRFASFITSPPTRVYPIIGRQGTALVFQIALLVAGVGSVLLGYRHGLVATTTILSLSCSTIYLVRLLFTFWLCGVSPIIIVANTLKPAYSTLLIVTPILLSVYVFDRASPSDTIFLVCFAASLVMLILYYVQIVRLGGTNKE